MIHVIKYMSWMVVCDWNLIGYQRMIQFYLTGIFPQ